MKSPRNLSDRSAISPAMASFIRRGGYVAVTMMSLLMLAGIAAGQSTITINANSNNGAILHGASGWLYGQAELDVPSQNLMAPLKPQFSAQKPPNGLQHAGGDANLVIPSYLSSGGKGEQVYLQDIFDTFYPNPGIASYTSTVQSIVNSLKSSPDFQDFIYVPFNEPDGVVYGSYGKGMTNLSGFESDWVTIFNAIRAINPNAQIAGPNFFLYSHSNYQAIYSYMKSHNALPTQTTWHELTNTTYTDWYSEYSDYRGIESSLGISPIPIVINEYGETSGMGVPGQLMQYIARFESSRVYGCLAYWTPDGDLSYLGATGQPNVPTPAWWLYQWYGEMLGNNLTVTPPNENANGLQGVATLDSNTHQIKAIFGGTSGTVNVNVQGLSSVSYLSGTVHVTVWGVDAQSGNTGGSGSGPYYIQEGNYTESGGDITVSVPSTKSGSAYYMIVTPNKSTSNVNSSTKYEAEYADLFNGATAEYGGNTGYSGTYFVQGYTNSNGAATEFDVQANPSGGFGGYYNLDLRYSAPNGASSVNLYLNGSDIETVNLPATANANTWSDATVTVFLLNGINRIAYVGNGSSNGIQLDYLNITSGSGTTTQYEATATANTLGGAAVRQNNSSAPGNGTQVGYVGSGSANYLQFNDVNVPSSGTYRMTVYYASDEIYTGSHAGQVFRYMDLSVNGGASTQLYYDVTYNWDTFLPMEFDVNLNAGNNTIRFSNPTTTPSPNLQSGYVPVIATILINSPY
jgi:hypothetical protein